MVEMNAKEKKVLIRIIQVVFAISILYQFLVNPKELWIPLAIICISVILLLEIIKKRRIKTIH